MVKKIKFHIDAQGEVSVSVEGAVGKECEELTAEFERSLGVTTAKEYKDCYYQNREEETVNAQDG